MSMASQGPWGHIEIEVDPNDTTPIIDPPPDQPVDVPKVMGVTIVVNAGHSIAVFVSHQGQVRIDRRVDGPVERDINIPTPQRFAIADECEWHVTNLETT